MILNLGVPVYTIYSLDAESIRARIGEPSDIEKELSNKGVDMDFGEVMERGDFWFYSIIAFMTIGAVRTIDENSHLFALGNEGVMDEIEGGYNVFEVVGALVFGSAIVFLRQWIRPSAMICWQLVILTYGFLIMTFPDYLSTSAAPIVTTVKISALVEGGLFVSLATFVHEEYGTQCYALIFGCFMSAGAAGLYVLDQVFILTVMDKYKHELSANGLYFKANGDWNRFLFGSLAALALICFVVTLFSHWKIVKVDKEQKNKLKMIQF